MKKTITITIGRNIGPHPLPNPGWSKFRSRITHMLAGHAIHVEDALSRGKWMDAEEDTSTWVACIDERYLAEITRNLERAAAEFDQECIALTVGKTKMVEPKL